MPHLLAAVSPLASFEDGEVIVSAERFAVSGVCGGS